MKDSPMWIPVPGNDAETIRLEWKCPSCDEIDEVCPQWMQRNGTPTCTDCDVDMEFLGASVSAHVIPELVQLWDKAFTDACWRYGVKGFGIYELLKKQKGKACDD